MTAVEAAVFEGEEEEFVMPAVMVKLKSKKKKKGKSRGGYEDRQESDEQWSRR